MRYPEVSSLEYHPEQEALTVAFMIRRELNAEQVADLSGFVAEILEAYRSITRTPLERIDVRSMTVGSMTVVELERDVKTLSVEEVGMVIEMLRERFDTDVLADPNDLLEEEMLVQEENIQASLEAIKKGKSGQLVALREDGRVVVFQT